MECISSMWNFAMKIFVIIFLVFNVLPECKHRAMALGVKGGLFNWNMGVNNLDNGCAGNGVRLLNLLNVVCSTAQALNTTARDGCYGCFIRYTSLPQGQTQLIGLSSCASVYFPGTPYASCATRLAIVSGNVAVLTPTNGQCTAAFCEFVRCLRKSNANSVIAQCGREVRALAAVNITQDNDNIRFYTNMTSCILAKTRCNTYNPITGELQLPGVVAVGPTKAQSSITLYNTLQTAPDGALRIVSFPATLAVTSMYCSNNASLAQANWLNNECP